MKKLSLLFLLPILFFSCSSDDNEPKQDYTSFVVEMDDYSLEYIKLAYQKDGIFIKLADIGKLKFGETSKEINIDNSISEIYLFGSMGSFRLRAKEPFILNKSSKNTLLIGSKTAAFVDVENIKDPTLYPQD